MACINGIPKRFNAPFLFQAFVFLTLLCLSPVVPTGNAAADETNPEKKTPHSIVHTGKGLSFHKEMFILPVSVSNEYNDKQCEVIFQVSAKQRLFDTNFYFGYTQISFWQAYDVENSSPFRETNYNPEFFYRIQPGTLIKKNFGADIGFEHESNGQSVPLSRSWNRLYIAPYYVNNNLILYGKCWYILPEKEKESPTSSEGSDNPDIDDYMGYGELHTFYQFFDNHLVHGMLRGNVSTGKGAIGINYSFPAPSGNTFIVFRFFNGYGESLIDYNNYITRIGLGVMFKR